MAISCIAPPSTDEHLAAWLGVSFATVNRLKDGATQPQKGAQGCHCPLHTKSRSRRKQRRVTTSAQVGRHSGPPRSCQRTVAVHQAHETDAVGRRLLAKRWRWPVKRKRCWLASPTLATTPTNNADEHGQLRAALYEPPLALPQSERERVVDLAAKLFLAKAQV